MRVRGFVCPMLSGGGVVRKARAMSCARRRARGTMKVLAPNHESRRCGQPPTHHRPCKQWGVLLMLVLLLGKWGGHSEEAADRHRQG